MKIFLNLTNGLEVLEGSDLSFDGFIRIQSTHLEQRNYNKVIEQLDSNFLMWNALNFRCLVIDYGSRRSDGNPKALRIGLEYIMYVLNNRWFGIENITDQNKKQIDHFRKIELDRSNKRKIDYYKNFLPKDHCLVDIGYIYNHTDHDHDKEYYRKVMMNWREKNV